MGCPTEANMFARSIAILFCALACQPATADVTEPRAADACPTVEPSTTPEGVVETVTVLGSYGDTDFADWAPLMSGNPPDMLLGGERCASGDVCYDCLHLPSNDIVRWYMADDGTWFEAYIGTAPVDFAGERGAVGTDGVYYGFDSVSGCQPFFDRYVR